MEHQNPHRMIVPPQQPANAVTVVADPGDLWGAPPPMYRISALDVQDEGHLIACSATFYHRRGPLHVTWKSRQVGVEEGLLVRPRGGPRAAPGAFEHQISRPSVLARPEPDVDLFETVPPSWGVPVDLLDRASALFARLPRAYRHLFNALVWDAGRFQRFCQWPGSLGNHHKRAGGLLEHTVDAAEIAWSLCQRNPKANAELTLLATLVHDLGKTDDYVWNPRGYWYASNRCRLIGHGVTIVEWIAVAAAVPGVALSQEAYEALVHLLTARDNAPSWLGIRRSAMIEGEILSHADRVSGRGDLHARLAAPGGGWGTRHPHRGSQPYTLPERSEQSPIQGRPPCSSDVPHRYRYRQARFNGIGD